jgi:flagellar hook assembly protein FlgD
VENLEQAGKEHFATVYPNPSSEIFNFKIKSPVPTPASVSIYDISGRMIRQLRTNISADGMQSVEWDGKLANGSVASAGIYIVHIATTVRFETIKIIKN